jgi:signal transduction histidine kinase
MLGISIAFLILFAVTSYVALGVTQESTAAISEARLRLAVNAANSVNILLGRSAAQLRASASSYAPDESSSSLREDAEVLYRQYGMSETFEWLALVQFGERASAGVVPRLEPLEAELSSSEVVWQTWRMGTPRIGEISLPGVWNKPRLVLTFSVTERGSPGQVMAAVMRPSLLEAPLPQAEGLVARVIDAEGAVLAGRVEGEEREDQEHMRLLKPLIEAREPGIVTHRAHAGHGHIVAYAPLEGLDGGLLIEESRDVALAVPSRLRTTMVWLGVVALAILVASAALHSQMVVSPVIRLARAAQNITRGVLDEPVPTKGLGEVEMLARNLEGMRLALKEAQEQRLGFERELEGRVRERTQQVEQLMSQIISIQEEERRRLARELHDETAQTLATVLVNLQAAQQVQEREKSSELVALALAQEAQVLTDIRRIISALRPAALDDLGLISALRAYAEERLAAQGTAVQFEVAGEERPLSPAIETAVFRILQEAINNIAKHAAARKTSLNLEYSPDSLRAVVEDDGRGSRWRKSFRATRWVSRG